METKLPGKDASLEETIEKMSSKLRDIGVDIEVTSWLNPVPHVWSVHIRDKQSPMCFTNGKGASKNAALASAYGEYFERLSCNYFYADWFFGKELANSEFAHYPNEKWFPHQETGLPEGLMDEYLLNEYDPNRELSTLNLVDTNSGNTDRGVCSLPFVRQSDGKVVYIPMNIIGNLYVSNGMSAGNTKYEARVQCLSEVFERYVKNKIIFEELSLPRIPEQVLARYPKVVEGITKLEEEGFPVHVYDASLGGRYPVINVTLMNPENGGVFASFGAHPRFEVALERTLTELLQGRRLDGLDVIQKPTFNEYSVCNNENLENHFIDSTGVISWKFFSEKSDFEFSDWNFAGSTKEEYDYLMKTFLEMEKEVYIADYDHLGVTACRILVPGVSEIYNREDLIDDNNNRSIVFRENILGIHQLSKNNMEELLRDLDESGLDDFMPVSELIGVVFNPDSGWQDCTIGDLKIGLCLALGDLEGAKNLVELYMNFGENKSSMTYYLALDSLLDMKLQELELDDYRFSFDKLYGRDIVDHALASIERKTLFYGLDKLDTNLSSLTVHQGMLGSFKKMRAKMIAKSDWIGI